MFYLLKISVALIFLFILILVLNKNDKKDEFYSSIPYEECVEKGYSKEFCIKNPTSLFGPSVCMCDDGKVGRVIPGFKGKCLCNEGLMGKILNS